MTVEIHPTAIVSDKAKLGVNVKVGPFSIIEDNVEIGDNTEISSNVKIKDFTTIGNNCKIFEGAIIGNIPQHLGFEGEESFVKIGNNVVIREYVTIHRGTKFDDGITLVDDNTYLMAYVHIAHDCKVGKNTILANNVTLAGHVKIGNNVFIGGLTPIHQFCRIGNYAMVGGASAVDKDIPPFTRASKNHAKLYGLNLVGLRRHGFDRETIRVLKEAYKIIFLKSPTLEEGINEALKKLPHIPQLLELIEFIKTSKRGIAPDATKKKT